MKYFVHCALLLAACAPPSPGLRLELTETGAQQCGSTKCVDIPLQCATWISIRIVDPADPTAPYLSQCQPVPPNGPRNLCAVGAVDLDTPTLPLRDLEVQVALYPESAVTFDPETNEPVCPSVQYDAVNGFPVESASSPALGGRSYYHPGDEEFVVTLGCTNLEAVNEATCGGLGVLDVFATVDDFDLRFSVNPTEAMRLSVDVGEPRSSNDQFVLNPGDLSPLELTTGSTPAWTAVLDSLFSNSACLAVLDDTPQSTTSLTCVRTGVTSDELNFTKTNLGRNTGVRLRKSSLDQILTTLGLTQFPPQGLTIGVVLDARDNALSNLVVSAPGATIKYLSADRNSVVGSTTSASGIFVSEDAPFGTTFSTTSGTIAAPSALGGLIEGKVTIVMLQFLDPEVD